jgi:hypothetical protein
MAFAVIRVVVLSAANQQPGQIWLCSCSYIEQTVPRTFCTFSRLIVASSSPYGSLIICIDNTPAMTPIMVACLASFRAFGPSSQDQSSDLRSIEDWESKTIKSSSSQLALFFSGRSAKPSTLTNQPRTVKKSLR